MGLSSESDFSLAVARIAVAQICQSVGYGAARTSALEVLSDVAARYLKAIGKSAVASANSLGRTQSNLFDIVIALEDLGSVQGFSSASSSTTPNALISSSLLKEIKKFVLYADEIPFAQPLPRKNVPTLKACGGHRNEKANDRLGMNLRHVPRWLPDMPLMGRKEGETGKRDEILSLRGDFCAEKRVEGEGKGKEKGKGRGEVFELPVKRGKVRFEMGVKEEWGVKMGGRVLTRRWDW